VTSNLYDALVGLRRPDIPMPMWIDQIIINQQDMGEKSSQVMLMGQIYSRAARVLVWLSKELFDSEVLLNHFGQLSTFCNSLALVAMLRGSSTLDNWLASENLSVPSLSEDVWNSVFTVFQNNYFRRVWMIQEVVRAKECFLILSGCLVEWDRIVGSWVTLYKLSPEEIMRTTIPQQMSKNARTLMTMTTIRGRLQGPGAMWLSRPKWTLIDFLRKSWGFEATDERDRVYALAGLLEFEDHCVPQPIFPDYSKEATLYDIARRVLVHSLTEENNLNCLFHCNPTLGKEEPSWMAAVEGNFSMPYQLGITEGYAAAGNSVAKVQPILNNKRLLSFKITRIGRVSDHALPFPGAITFPELKKRSAECFNFGRDIDWKKVQLYAIKYFRHFTQIPTKEEFNRRRVGEI
jgi:hypothetical protein